MRIHFLRNEREINYYNFLINFRSTNQNMHLEIFRKYVYRILQVGMIKINKNLFSKGL